VPAPIGTGQSLSLDGSSWVDVTPPAAFFARHNYTVTAWAQVTSASGAQAVFATRRPTDAGFDMKFQNNDRIHGDIGNGSSWLTTGADAFFSPPPYAPNTWYHIAYVVRPSGYDIRVRDTSGTLVATASGSYGANSPLLMDANHHVNIGRYNAGAEYLNGLIDNVAVWSQALNEVELSHLAAGAPPSSIRTADPATLSYIPITSDADSGIDASKTYTHAIDCGQGSPAPNVNGVQFTRAVISSLPPNFSIYTTSGSQNDHPGNSNFSVTGNIAEVFRDMIYNGNNSPGGIARYTLSGLIPGVEYDARIYTRQWGSGGTRTSDIAMITDGGSLGVANATINQDDASAVPPGFADPAQAYAISTRYRPLGTEFTAQFRQHNPNWSWHLYGVTNEFVLPTTQMHARITADDSYELYVSGYDDQLGLLVGSGSGWQTPEDHYFDVPIGQKLYLHVVGHNGGASPAGILGQFDAGNEILKAIPLKFYTDDVIWGGNLVGYGELYQTVDDLGANGVSPWGTIPGMDPEAHWVWLGTGNRPAGEIVYLSYPFFVTPTPEPATLLVLAGGLVALARRRRAKKTGAR